MKNLIIRPHGIGDIVMLIPALRGLVKNNPQEEFTLLTYKGTSQVLPLDLGIDVIEMPRHAGFKETLKLIKQIRHRHFDRLFDLFCNPRTAQITLLSGIKDTYGFPCRYRSFVYKNKYYSKTHMHQVDLYCNFFQTFGLKCEACPPNVIIPNEIIKEAEKAIPEKYRKTNPLIAVNINATYPSKAWPVDLAAKFINQWYEKTKQPVMLTWGPGEENGSKQLLEIVGEEKAFLHKAVNIRNFVALLSLVKLLITNDAGPTHMAWEVNTPTITLFGPTTEQDVEPRGENHITLRAQGIECARCHKEHCPTKKCMNAISPEMVFEAVKQLKII